VTTGAAPLYPASLVVSGRACLVVGAGQVATRKAVPLAECGADLTVVAPDVGPEMERLADRYPVTLERRAYARGEAAAYDLVVSATGVADVDRLVASDARRAGAWVNVASDAGACTFFVPAVHRDGRVTVAVSTGGASPALAGWLRDRVATALGPGLGSLADLLAEARRRAGPVGGRRPRDWRTLLDGPLPRLVATGRLAEARRLLETPPG